MVGLRTLGELTVVEGGERVRLATKKQYALLVFLAGHVDRPILRERLATLLWGDSPTARARHSLSQALYGVRRRLPKLPLQVVGDEVLLPGDAVDADFVAFRAAFDQGRYRDAVDLYRGDFLQAFWVSGARAFEEWQENEREAMRQQVSYSLHRLLTEEERSGHWLEVERLATRFLQLDPFIEDVHRIRIQAIAAGGDRARAVRVWRRVQELFDRELGRVPADLAAAVQPLLRSPAGRAPAPADIEDGEAPTRFVGRGAQFERLRSAWERAKDGRGRLAVVSGEAGIGKTRLCRHFLRLAAIQGARCFHGRCYSTESQVPYSGITDSLADSLTPGDVSSLPRPWSSLLASMVPEIGAEVSEDVLPADHEEARRRLFEAFVQLLRGIGAADPIVLFIDDFQWADDSTIALVHHITRRLADSPVLVLLALRREDVSGNSTLRRFLRNSPPAREFEELRLSELTLQEAKELVASFAERHGLAVSDGLESRLLERVGGRPFFIIEYLQAYRQDQTIIEAETGPHSHVPSRPLPSSVEEYLASRFDELGETAAQLVGALAVLGRGAPLEILCNIGGVADIDALRAVASLIDRGIFVEAAEEIAFAHDLLREAAYRWIGGPRRRILHGRAAEALSRGGAAAAGIVAVHYDLAGNRRRACECAMAAAETSEKVHSVVEAEYFLRMALANADEKPIRYLAEERLAQFLYACRRHAAAEGHFATLEPYYLDKNDKFGLLLTEINRVATDFRHGASTAEESVGRLQRCLATAVNLGRGKIISDVLIMLADAALDAHRQSIMIDAGRRILSITNGLLPPREVCHNLACIANIVGLTESADRGLQISENALRLAQSLEDPELRVLALRSRAVNRIHAGYILEAFEDLDLARGLTDRVGNELSLFELRNTTSVLYCECGRYDEAKVQLLELIAQAKDTHATRQLIFASANLMLAEFESGDVDTSRAQAEQIIAWNRPTSVRWSDSTAWSILGLCALARGDYTEANRCRREVLLRFEGRDFWVSDVSYSEVFLARLTALEGEPEKALERLERAIAAYEHRDVFCRSRMQLERARLLREIDPTESRRQAEEVRARGLKIGARPLVDKADAILDRPVV